MTNEERADNIVKVGVPAGYLRVLIKQALDEAERRGPAASGPYRVGVADAATSIHYAGATFTHEVYGPTDPAEPIAVCETPEQAARLVALLNTAERRGREQAAEAFQSSEAAKIMIDEFAAEAVKVRREAIEEAARLCDECAAQYGRYEDGYIGGIPASLAAAIRALT